MDTTQKDLKNFDILTISGWNVEKQVVSLECKSPKLRFWYLLDNDSSILALFCVPEEDIAIKWVWEEAQKMNNGSAPILIYYYQGTILLDAEFTNHATHSILTMNAFPSPQDVKGLLCKEEEKEEEPNTRQKIPYLILLPMALIGFLSPLILILTAFFKRRNGQSFRPSVLFSPRIEGTTNGITNHILASATDDLTNRQIPKLDVRPSFDGQGSKGYDMVIIPSPSPSTDPQLQSIIEYFPNGHVICPPIGNTGGDTREGEKNTGGGGSTRGDTGGISPSAWVQQVFVSINSTESSIQQTSSSSEVSFSSSETQETNNNTSYINNITNTANITNTTNVFNITNNTNNNMASISMEVLNITVNYQDQQLTSITNWNTPIILISDIAPGIQKTQQKFNPIHIETMAEKESIRGQIEMAEELKRYLHGFQERLGAVAESYKKKCDDLYDAGMLREKIETFISDNLAETTSKLSEVVESINDKDIPYLEKYIEQLESL